MRTLAKNYGLNDGRGITAPAGFGPKCWNCFQQMKGWLFCLLLVSLSLIGCSNSGPATRAATANDGPGGKPKMESLKPSGSQIPGGELATPGSFTILVYQTSSQKDLDALDALASLDLPFSQVYSVDMTGFQPSGKNAGWYRAGAGITVPSIILYGPTANIMSRYNLSKPGLDSLQDAINYTLSLIEINLGDKESIGMFPEYMESPEMQSKDGFIHVDGFDKIFRINDLVDPDKISIVEFGTTYCGPCRKLRAALLAENFDPELVDLYTVNLDGGRKYDSLRNSVGFKLWQLEGQLDWPFTYLVMPGSGIAYAFPPDDPSKTISKIEDVMELAYQGVTGITDPGDPAGGYLTYNDQSDRPHFKKSRDPIASEDPVVILAPPTLPYEPEKHGNQPDRSTSSESVGFHIEYVAYGDKCIGMVFDLSQEGVNRKMDSELYTVCLQVKYGRQVIFSYTEDYPLADLKKGNYIAAELPLKGYKNNTRYTFSAEVSKDGKVLDYSESQNRFHKGFIPFIFNSYFEPL